VVEKEFIIEDSLKERNLSGISVKDFDLAKVESARRRNKRCF
jgi:hypothetical protein